MQALNQRLVVLAVVLAALFVAAACGPIGAVPEYLDPIYERMARQPLAYNPVTATAVGYHSHTTGEGESAQTINLDEQLDDYSAGSVAEQIEFYQMLGAWLHNELEGKEEVPARDTLNGDYWVNYQVVENRVNRALFRLQEEKPYARDPNFYVELLGRALFVPLTVEYAPENERFGHIVARLQKVPAFLETAKGNVSSSSELQIESAVDEVEGLIQLIEGDVADRMPEAMAANFEAAAGPAVEALNGYKTYLGELPSDADWRMGAQLFEKRLQMYAGNEESLDSLLEQLQAEYDATYQEVIEAAKPIHRSIYGGQRAPSDFALMRDILDVVSDDNRQRSGDGLRPALEENVEEVKQFMQAEELVPIPSIGLQITDTPPFLRSKYPVSAFQPPPLLNPDLGAEYWVTPIPSSASRAETLARLREYNNFKLQIVAIDGFARYVQAALAAQGEGANNRLIRNVDGNRGTTSGWNWYLVESAMNNDYQGGAGDQFQMTWQKYKLEFLASCILDIKLHAQNMPLEEARELLKSEVFMESGAIESAVRRIQLTPTETLMTYVGAKNWDHVKQEYTTQTQDFSLQSFHGNALRAGALPPAELIYVTVQARSGS